MVRVGIAGFGFMGRFHHAAYAKAEAGEVVAVFDVNPEVFANAATEGNIGVAEADLTGVKLGGADLTLADLSGATWTDGKRVCSEGSIGRCN